MRISRQILALITLFCLFFELCEPSTNFIRTSPVSQQQQQDHDHGPSLKSMETHAAQIVVSFHFEFTPVYDIVYFSHIQSIDLDEYSNSIFQPPKAA
ncbi:MAG: hypothetical protein JSU04_18300 [Bdellovibrionales bacterium]|nr:hypothetical protein [Bdellovibrionales bacterium]